MEHEKYVKSTKLICDLAEGMTHSQWKNVNELIEDVYRAKESNTTFEKPGNIDILIRTAKSERAFIISAEMQKKAVNQERR